VLFMRFASAFVALPGCLGTLDELFEALTLMQTNKNPDFPVVPVERDFWSGLLSWIEQRLVGEGKVAAGELALVTVADRPAEVVEAVLTGAARQGRLPR
jgi:uncharacterized protein (TIGR00730 family)